MTPMIDVVFLLLVFFVWTASFHAVEYLPPSSLSQKQGTGQTVNVDEPPPEIEFEDIVVHVSRLPTINQLGLLMDNQWQVSRKYEVD